MTCIGKPFRPLSDLNTKWAVKNTLKRQWEDEEEENGKRKAEKRQAEEEEPMKMCERRDTNMERALSLQCPGKI